MKYNGQVLPVDGFAVLLNVSLPQQYQASLYHLYQPLIGMEAVHLYEFFVHEAQLTSQLSIERQTHHTMMNHLNLSLKTIYEARLKLEGIGLLKTLKQEDRQGNLFIYKLIPPFSPQQFFNDLMLRELLKRHVGDRRFEKLCAYYHEDLTEEVGKDITASFHDVFQTYEALSPPSSSIKHTEEERAAVPIEKIDLSIIKASLQQRNIPIARVLTEKNERIIHQLTNLYDLESYELEKALLWALTDENTLDVEQFKAACHDLFTTKKNVGNIKLTFRTEENNHSKEVKRKPQSKTEELINHFESISPKQLLEDLSRGNNASEADLKMISDIMVKQGLPVPVMNVLIHLTMLKTNMMLSRTYMERVASHWSRANIKTARQAMEFAKQQTEQAKKQSRKVNQPYRKQASRNDEVIPAWFNRRHKETSEKEPALSEDEKKAQEEMAAILKKYSHE